MGVYEEAIRPTKERLFSRLAGDVLGGVLGGEGGDGNKPLRVLEIGIGTGPNLPYLTAAFSAAAAGDGPNPPLHVTGIDPNAAMQPYALESAQAAGLAEALSLVQGDAQRMPFADGEFDAAVITLVLCSVPDPSAALSEIRRVVKPGGRLLMIEHVAAPLAGRPLLAVGQRVLEPLQRLVADGCHLTRDTKAAVARAGFAGGAEPLESFDVPGLGILAPHVAGVLTV